MPLTFFTAASGSPCRSRATVRLLGFSLLPLTRVARPCRSPYPFPLLRSHLSTAQATTSEPDIGLPGVAASDKPSSTGSTPRKGLVHIQASRTHLIIGALPESARDLYGVEAKSKWHGDSQIEHGRKNAPNGQLGSASRIASALSDKPVSLHGILVRYITSLSADSTNYRLTDKEKAFLQLSAYPEDIIKQWAESVLISNSVSAAEILADAKSRAPMFLIMLFLRRRRVRKRALGMIMRHLGHKLQSEAVTWAQLEAIVTQLIRHARVLWPQTFPWISNLVITEVTRLLGAHTGQRPGLPALTRFCNRCLSAFSVPASVHPVQSAAFQQKAQFKLLDFMARHDPPLIVSRIGFRATMRVQLAHPKTSQERDWALLKGPTWPPWIQERTGLDVGKNYAYGASRASHIIHRMYEGGYGNGPWENLAQMYAGWDTDLSPTIQTRTILPGMSNYCTNKKRLERYLWAARIRTTRTRREAWACFLESESSATGPCPEAYYAMMEKLASSEVVQKEKHPREEHREDRHLLPGDVKEVFPDPDSLYDSVYISEPVPSLGQLYDRMKKKGIQPTRRVLALLMKFAPDVRALLDLIGPARSQFDGDVGRLLDGSILQQARISMPCYFWTSFIHALCRLGRFTVIPTLRPMAISKHQHMYRLEHDKGYLLQYAYQLIIKILPSHRATWTVFLKTLLFSPWNLDRSHHQADKATIQYRILDDILDKMKQAEVDIDDEQFKIVCIALRNAALFATQGRLPPDDARKLISTGPRRIRSLFLDLTNAYLDTSLHRSEDQATRPLPQHIPPLVVLHAYVRTLGFFNDFEGIYSFIVWMEEHKAGIEFRLSEHRNKRWLRRVLIAVRAGMEGKLGYRGQGAPDELSLLVKNRVEEVESWEGWPSDQEVELYMSNKYGR
ncbi:hypothetical protein M011DRAFT_435314 [Sporormia fimetaria CBS 119925]|uniref:Prefoldin subunit n=1 Tax=Sporormia fimetaria CBS 119925 TaxID=1340428 RepID=A0A6A6VPB2_9PLEO|nr:hypothetical protein M011DRAFT_435314 [Sporormia fimetaria CBS 119925]